MQTVVCRETRTREGAGKAIGAWRTLMVVYTEYEGAANWRVDMRVTRSREGEGRNRKKEEAMRKDTRTEKEIELATVRKIVVESEWGGMVRGRHAGRKMERSRDRKMSCRLRLTGARQLEKTDDGLRAVKNRN